MLISLLEICEVWGRKKRSRFFTIYSARLRVRNFNGSMIRNDQCVADRGRGNIGQVSMAVPPRKAPRRHRPAIRNRLVLLRRSRKCLLALAARSVSWKTPPAFFCLFAVWVSPLQSADADLLFEQRIQKRLLRSPCALSQRPPRAQTNIRTSHTKSTKKSPKQVVSSFGPESIIRILLKFPTAAISRPQELFRKVPTQRASATSRKTPEANFFENSRKLQINSYKNFWRTL